MFLKTQLKEKIMSSNTKAFKSFVKGFVAMTAVIVTASVVLRVVARDE